MLNFSGEGSVSNRSRPRSVLRVPASRFWSSLNFYLVRREYQRGASSNNSCRFFSIIWIEIAYSPLVECYRELASRWISVVHRMTTGKASRVPVCTFWLIHTSFVDCGTWIVNSSFPPLEDEKDERISLCSVHSVLRDLESAVVSEFSLLSRTNENVRSKSGANSR